MMLPQQPPKLWQKVRTVTDVRPHTDISPCDALRDVDSALAPDARWKGFAVLDSGGVRPASLQDRQMQIARFVLSSAVPPEIRVHFETAKNLFLYAWFVYRFHPVAEQQVLASLEFALRERLKGEKDSASRRSGLSALLKTAQIRGLIRNDAIRNCAQWAMELARERYRHEALQQMIGSNTEEMILDETDVQPTDADLTYDWIGNFVESLPRIRNIHAHGTGMLYPNVLRTFDIVSDLINQLYGSDRVSPLNDGYPAHC